VAKAQAASHAASQHYDLGEYREALEGFKEAYRNHEDPTFLFNIAQCHRQLGDKASAIRAYRTFLYKLPDSPNRVQVREMIARMEKQLADEQASKGGPPQGTLSPKAGPIPTPAPTRETAASVPPPQLAAPPANEATAPKPGTPTVTTQVAETQPKPVYKRWWLWTAVAAVVVVGVGVGLGVGLSSHSSGTPTCSCRLGTFTFKF
jgi:tetratricopeptide (TPR) repeat protein